MPKPAPANVDPKKFKLKKKHLKVKIKGDHLKDGTPKFATTSPTGVTWLLENVDSSDPKEMRVDATPNTSRKSGKKLETGDLTITVDSSAGTGSVTFTDIEYEAP